MRDDVRLSTSITFAIATYAAVTIYTTDIIITCFIYRTMLPNGSGGG